MFREAPTFPEELAFGARGGPKWSTAVTRSAKVIEQRNQNWSQALWTYQIGMVNRQTPYVRQLLAFFRAVAVGRAYGFRLRDFLPGGSTAFDVQLGTGDDVNTVWHLVKAYVSGAETYVRRIYKPVVGTLIIRLDDTPTTAWTCDYATGVVAFTAPPGDGVEIRADFTFDVPVRFDQDSLPIQRLDYEQYTLGNITLTETRDIAA